MIKNKKLKDFYNYKYSIDDVVKEGNFYIISNRFLSASELKAKLTNRNLHRWDIARELKVDPYGNIPDDLNKVARYDYWCSDYNRFMAKIDTNNIMHKTFNKNLVEVSSWSNSVRYKHYSKNFKVDPLVNSRLKINRKTIETIDATETRGCSFEIGCTNLKEAMLAAGTEEVIYSNKYKETDFPDIKIQNNASVKLFSIVNSKINKKDSPLVFPVADNYMFKNSSFGENSFNLVGKKITIQYCNIGSNISLEADDISCLFSADNEKPSRILKSIKGVNAYVCCPYDRGTSHTVIIEDLQVKKLKFRYTEDITITIKNLYISDANKKINLTNLYSCSQGHLRLNIENIIFDPDMKTKEVQIGFFGDFNINSSDNKRSTGIKIRGEEIGLSREETKFKFSE